MKNHIHVTCAVIEKNGQVLVARRKPDGSRPSEWEFPGGKIEQGETAEECLVREINEELGIQVVITKSLDTVAHEYPEFYITLYPFICEIKSGEPVAHEHEKIVWKHPREIPSSGFSEADLPVLKNYLME